MLILDNIIFSLQRAGGISVVWENLIRGVSDNFKVKYLEYQKVEQNINRNSLNISSSNIISKTKIPLLIEQFRSPTIDYHVGVPFIFHSSYYRTCKHPNAKNVTTVHDFIYELAQTNRTFSQLIRSNLNLKAIINSDYIVCISENTKNDLLKLLPEVSSKPIFVIYNGVSTDYFPMTEKLDNYSEFYLYVGGRQGYKNFDFAVRMTSLNRRKLLVCGGALSRHECELLNKYLGEGNYHFELHPSNEQLNKYYNSVEALIYPSSYEGFGIPILEAQRAGCPVIALNSSSIPEIIGETPLLLSDLNQKSFKNALNILSHDKIRSEIIEAGLKNSQRFSWEKMSREYLELYKEIMK